MPRILIVECMQEISSFNPLPSGYENFHIERGDELYAQRGLEHRRSAARCAVFEARPDVAVVPAICAHGRAAPACCRPPVGASSRPRSWTRSRQTIDRGRRRSTSRCTARWAPTASSIRKAICSAKSRAHGRQQADRHLARSARHPDRPDAAADRRPGDLPHLSARRLRRHRRARRRAPAAADRPAGAGRSSRASSSRRWSAATS